ncbi:hypothetical protein B0H12DRAFT_1076219 [Mycena haematopus]|nr:hypothetical protein B0H12DRAFT_1076219 [Mycena haematopus]
MKKEIKTVLDGIVLGREFGGGMQDVNYANVDQEQEIQDTRGDDTKRVGDSLSSGRQRKCSSHPITPRLSCVTAPHTERTHPGKRKEEDAPLGSRREWSLRGRVAEEITGCASGGISSANSRQRGGHREPRARYGGAEASRSATDDAHMDFLAQLGVGVVRASLGVRRVWCMVGRCTRGQDLWSGGGGG